MVPNHTNNNNSILFEVVASIFTSTFIIYIERCLYVLSITCIPVHNNTVTLVKSPQGVTLTNIYYTQLQKKRTTYMYSRSPSQISQTHGDCERHS